MFTFQFQKVRLKATCGGTSRCGSATVSIPKGSIKSVLILKDSSGALLFQFQKVRLKGQSFLLTLFNTLLFQFQKVRLKVSSLPMIFLIVPLFQFQKVRLKVGCLHHNKFNSLVSIPKGSIKRRSACSAALSIARFNSKRFD